ncbi:two-component system regulatory protein [Novosphingobium sp. Rr 2-17]|uniref:RNA polymerase sigma factor n=1 Tax=Novosphingobium sp. Rr 2-17 TaxID=555793 RepID=UPI000269AB95|nr:RNA polymerase sigma factor [Novosphingobium sp. Rr 2-17]EIZ78304.1 two-component system regulatory protein [Novosphingobium sp. Rr 2-17]
MIDDATLKVWFCSEVLPLEAALSRYIRRNCSSLEDIVDLRQEIYERALKGASEALPDHSQRYVYTIARNLLINRAKRERIISFELVADLGDLDQDVDLFVAERQLIARDELRRAQAGMAVLPARCREVVWLRKVEGLSTREAAERLGVGLDTIERQLTLGMRALADFMLGGSGKIKRTPALPRRDRA